MDRPAVARTSFCTGKAGIAKQSTKQGLPYVPVMASRKDTASPGWKRFTQEAAGPREPVFIAVTEIERRAPAVHAVLKPSP